MSDIKTTIVLLCKHLNFLFGMDLKPEMFRAAKYNKPEVNAVQEFWSLLKKLTGSNTIQEVKEHFLKNLNYNCICFYGLQSNMASSGRDLLIAFAHILALGYLNNSVKNRVNKSPLNQEHTYESKELLHSDIEHYSFNLKQFKSESDYIHAIEWVEGRIELNRREIQEYKEQFQKLGRKIGKTHINSSMSLTEIFALYDVNHAKAYLEQSDAVIKILQNHEKWLKQEVLFWEWMHSVLFERYKDAQKPNFDGIKKFMHDVERL